MAELESWSISSQQEIQFDQITRLASRFFKCPAATIGFVSGSREWFKSSVGFALTEIERDHSLDAWTILGDGVMIVPDAKEDARFSENPLVTGTPGIRFYAGVPIKSSKGFNLGVLSVLDFTSRAGGLTTEEAAILSDLASMAGAEIESQAQRRSPIRQTSAAGPEYSKETLSGLVHAISHDLRSPLSNVLQFSEMIEADFGDALGREGLELLGFIIKAAQRMERLVAGMMIYARIVLNPVEVQPIDANMILRLALEHLNRAILTVDATVTFDVLPTLRMSEIELAQLFHELIRNALMFRSTEPPRVHISAKSADDYWIFACQDNGLGIGPQHHILIFEPLKRLHGDEISGAGVGLATCKIIVERYGGRIWVESEEGRGSTFLFTLPADRRG